MLSDSPSRGVESMNSKGKRKVSCYVRSVPFSRSAKAHWVRADFNGLFGNILCLSHGPTCAEQSGAEITLRDGIVLTAFDRDADENGNRDDLVATGIVETSPEWLQCRGSRWILKIDENGVRSESELL